MSRLIYKLFLGLKDYMHKVSKYVAEKSSPPSLKLKSSLLFNFSQAHEKQSSCSKCCPIAEKYFFEGFSEQPSNQLFKIFGTCWLILTWNIWDVSNVVTITVTTKFIDDVLVFWVGKTPLWIPLWGRSVYRIVLKRTEPKTWFTSSKIFVENLSELFSRYGSFKYTFNLNMRPIIFNCWIFCSCYNFKD